MLSYLFSFCWGRAGGKSCYLCISNNPQNTHVHPDTIIRTYEAVAIVEAPSSSALGSHEACQIMMTVRGVPKKGDNQRRSKKDDSQS